MTLHVVGAEYITQGTFNQKLHVAYQGFSTAQGSTPVRIRLSFSYPRSSGLVERRLQVGAVHYYMDPPTYSAGADDAYFTVNMDSIQGNEQGFGYLEIQSAKLIDTYDYSENGETKRTTGTTDITLSLKLYLYREKVVSHALSTSGLTGYVKKNELTPAGGWLSQRLLGVPGVQVMPRSQGSVISFSPATATTDSNGGAEFLPVVPLSSFGSAASVADLVRVETSEGNSQYQGMTVYFATVTSMSGLVKIGAGSAITVADHLKAGDVISMSPLSEITIGFGDGKAVTWSNNTLSWPTITLTAAGAETSVPPSVSSKPWEDVRMVLRLAVSAGMLVSGVGLVLRTGISVGLWALDKSYGGSGKQSVAEVSSSSDTANYDLTAHLMGDGRITVENSGSPVGVSGGTQESILTPATTMSVAADTGTFSGVSSMTRTLGTSVPISITPGQGSVLQTQTPLLSFDYPQAQNNAIAPESFTARLNGVLVSPYMKVGDLSTKWCVPAEMQLKDGANTIEASVTIKTGYRSSASVQVTASTVPTVPTGLSAYPGSNSVILRWTPNTESDLAGYTVYRSTSADGTPQAISASTLSQPVLAYTGPITGWYSVAAKDKTGNSSARSTAVEATLVLTPTGVITPSDVSGFSAVAGEGSVRITFDYTNTTALAWRLKRAEAGGGPYNNVLPSDELLASSGYLDDSVVNGRSYSYRLIPLGYDLKEGNTAQAGPVTPTDAAPSAPRGLTAEVITDVVSLKWNPSSESDIAGYNVWRAGLGEAYVKRNSSVVTGTTFMETLNRDSLYAWRVTALDAAGNESQPSPMVQTSGRRSDMQHILGVRPSQGGLVSLSPSCPCKYGTMVSVSAAPLTGFAFIRWAGDLQGTQNPLALTVTEDLSISAVFEQVAIPGTLPVATLAGSGTAGYLDDTGANARFSFPSGVAADSAGNVYVADGTHRIRKITPSGEVTTLAGSGTQGSQNGTGTAASFNSPLGVAVDSSGNVYVADTGNHLIRKITPAGVVTTLAGSGTIGGQDGTGTGHPSGLPAGWQWTGPGMSMWRIPGPAAYGR